MSAQVQKLEALLARVQRNAETPRPARVLPRVPVSTQPLEPATELPIVPEPVAPLEAAAPPEAEVAPVDLDVLAEPLAAAEPADVAPVDLDVLEADLAGGEPAAPEAVPITAADPADLLASAPSAPSEIPSAPAPAVAEASISAEVVATPSPDVVAAEEEVLELEELGPADEADEVTAVSVALPTPAELEASPPTRRPDDEEAEAPPSSGRQLVAAPHESARMAVAAPLTDAPGDLGVDAQITLEPVVQAVEAEPEPIELELAEEHEAPPESSKSLRVGAEAAPEGPGDREAPGDPGVEPVAAIEAIEPHVIEVSPAELAPALVEAFSPSPVADEPPFVEGQIPEPPPTPLEGAPLPRYEAPPQTPTRVAPPVPVAAPAEPVAEASPIAAEAHLPLPTGGADSSPPPETLAPQPAAVVEKVVTAVSLIGAPQGRFEPVSVAVEAAVVRAEVTPTEVAAFVGAVRGPRATTFGDVLDAALDL